MVHGWGCVGLALALPATVVAVTSVLSVHLPLAVAITTLVLSVALLFLGLYLLVGLGIGDWWRRRQLARAVPLELPAAAPSPPDASVPFNRLRPADSLRSFSIPLRSGMAENIDDLLTEVPALRERVSMPFLADDRSLDLDLSGWERRVVAVLGDRSDLLDWFNSKPASTGPTTFAHPLATRLEHHVCMLSAIRDRL